MTVLGLATLYALSYCPVNVSKTSGMETLRGAQAQDDSLRKQ